MLCGFYRLIFKVIGWEMIGTFPDVNKFIVIVGPHTSNWDFVIGVIARGVTGRKIHYLGKKELFRPPIGWLFRWLGGYPVDRSQHQNMVQAVVEIFNKHEHFILALSPEGTRSPVKQWRTGFYYIAVKAGIPIVSVSIDYGLRQVKIWQPFYPNEDIAGDLLVLQGRFEGVKGKNR